jgi:hypothetical protein
MDIVSGLADGFAGKTLGNGSQTQLQMPTVVSSFFKGSSGTSITFISICIFLMLLFGFMAYYATIGMLGNTKASIFIAYCGSGWILLLSAVLILRILHSFIGF